jgi:CBS domain-containing protein
MSSIERELDEERYRETTVVHKRHLTDAVLRVPLGHVKAPGVEDVTPDSSVKEAIAIMKEKGIGAVLVCEKDPHRMLGIFTERDLLLRVAGKGWDLDEHKVSEVLTANPDCLTPRDTVGFALKMMMTHGYRHIPLIRKDGKPYGLVSVRDLLMYLSEHFPEDVINLPPEPKYPVERDGA